MQQKLNVKMRLNLHKHFQEKLGEIVSLLFHFNPVFVHFFFSFLIFIVVKAFYFVLQFNFTSADIENKGFA